MKFSSINGYMSSTMWLTSTILQLFTRRFCYRHWNRTNDPSGGMFDQMTRAARSATANIAEGLGRQQTSLRTELTLLDVTRASLAELYSDYYFILLEKGWRLWHQDCEEARKFCNLNIDPPIYSTDDWSTESMAYLRLQEEKLAPWCDSESPEKNINALMQLTLRLQKMIAAKMNVVLEKFSEHGGFTESLTRKRLERRAMQAAEAGAPECPLCHKPMIKRLIKSGMRQGNTFWGCSDFPRCRGTRPIKKS